MDQDLKKITHSALQLDESDRTELVKSLLESLGKNKILYEEEWMNLVRERSKEYKTKKSSSRSWEEVKIKLENQRTD